MAMTEKDLKGLRTTNLKKVANFIKMHLPWSLANLAMFSEIAYSVQISKVCLKTEDYFKLSPNQGSSREKLNR